MNYNVNQIRIKVWEEYGNKFVPKNLNSTTFIGTIDFGDGLKLDVKFDGEELYIEPSQDKLTSDEEVFIYVKLDKFLSSLN